MGLNPVTLKIGGGGHSATELREVGFWGKEGRECPGAPGKDVLSLLRQGLRFQTSWTAAVGSKRSTRPGQGLVPSLSWWGVLETLNISKGQREPFSALGTRPCAWCGFPFWVKCGHRLCCRYTPLALPLACPLVLLQSCFTPLPSDLLAGALHPSMVTSHQGHPLLPTPRAAAGRVSYPSGCRLGSLLCSLVSPACGPESKPAPLLPRPPWAPAAPLGFSLGAR